ncbi:uncharacterized protein F5147DRAFT_656437 [Suillus discolor]|uniref:Uncharacterized protein n=1 Tax=Suillus discolor TaxID=1912936 RepID=A0A9P7EZI2_9AGAM|nr:uncharacterized protein F5147DRAFT_656437 [Suillus discolor]KAG2096973.1 hypothetical protein F5147DRAFT_656437 [Suillus discolor]
MTHSIPLPNDLATLLTTLRLETSPPLNCRIMDYAPKNAEHVDFGGEVHYSAHQRFQEPPSRLELSPVVSDTRNAWCTWYYPPDGHDYSCIIQLATLYRYPIKNLIGGCSSFGALAYHLGVIMMLHISIDFNPKIYDPKGLHSEAKKTDLKVESTALRMTFVGQYFSDDEASVDEDEIDRSFKDASQPGLGL